MFFAYGENNAILDNCHVRIAFDAFADLGDKHFEPLAAQRTRCILILRRQRRGDGHHAR
ncbi:hypothetical protein HAP47_0026335 [Bradyrhizobium sp. 41S5]|uniref:hypothetical protein n=1 Tax=Bradyrhizobium sp. 41S5 TaxID=1404443 RepID=UPI00156B23D3|nr:hypothetical protein [Bradyrhizobium sp. 41S5]UFX42739.1 hypothetical protein HAP47_0026335 [Bradyrhizobium sp. 41S5]